MALSRIPTNLQEALTTNDVPLLPGAVVQTVSFWTDTVWSTTSTSPVATPVTASIIPRSATNKILVMLSISFGNNTDNYNSIDLYRNSTPIGRSTQASGNWSLTLFPMNNRSGDANWEARVQSFNYLDSPNTTSSITYTVYGNCDYGSPLYINRPNDTTNAAYVWRATSTITLMEIAG